jgi:hypothetical protein
VTRLQVLLLGVLVAIALAAGAWVGVDEYGNRRYEAGYNMAVEAGIKQRDHDAEENRKTEADLRAQLAERDAIAQRKEKEYASNLADAQRRVRAGTDRLRCPAAGPVQPSAAAADRPAAGAPAVDGPGTELVPDASANILGVGATFAGLVRKYDEVTGLYETCRRLNNK